jgi:hypothetical protein
LIDTVALAEHEVGLVRLVVDSGGGILALSERMPEIIKAGAPIKADKKMADIASAIEAVRTHGENSGALLDSAGKRAIVYARVGSHPWTLVTLVPNAQLTSGTTGSALVFSGLAVLAVILVVVLVGLGIKQAFAAPMKQLAQAESELRSVAEREKSAIQVSEDLAKQLEEARRKTKTLESEVSAARAEVEAARAEAAAAVAAAASAAAGGAMMEGEAGSLDGEAIPTEPGEELIAPLDVDTAQA